MNTIIKYSVIIILVITSVNSYGQLQNQTMEPGTIVNAGPTGATFDSTMNAIGSDDVWSTANLVIPGFPGATFDTSKLLMATNFGFTVLPSTTTILGIRAEIEAHKESFIAGNGATISKVFLVKGGVIQSFNNAVGGILLNSDASIFAGSSSDLWDDATLTAADINAANFGIAFGATGTLINGGGIDILVDNITLYVYYDSSVAVSTTTTIEVANNNIIKYIQNPAGDQLNIQLNARTTDKVMVEIISLQGKKLYAQNYVAGEAISIKDFATGMYILRINSIEMDKPINRLIIKE